MKKVTLWATLLATLLLCACSLNWDAKLKAAQDYCDSTNWTLTQQDNLYVCTYEDGSVCESEDFREGSCIDLEESNEDEYAEARALVDTEEKRIAACEEKTLFTLNINEADFTWEDESEAGASFARNGHVNYEKNSTADGEMVTASDDIFCFIDMVDWTTTVELSNHEYLWEAEENNENNDEVENEGNEEIVSWDPLIDETEPADEPVAEVSEWTAE